VPSSAGGPGLFPGDLPDLALLGGDLLEVLDLDDVDLHDGDLHAGVDVDDGVDLRDDAGTDDDTAPATPAPASSVENESAGGAFEDVRR
jgi:hypothetical protein